MRIIPNVSLNTTKQAKIEEVKSDINSYPKIEEVKSDINSYPKIESHYCRSSSKFSYLDLVVQSIYAQKRVNLKQIAIVIMMTSLVSTIYLHYQKQNHRNPRGGTLSFLTIMTSVRKSPPVTFWHSEM